MIESHDIKTCKKVPCLSYMARFVIFSTYDAQLEVQIIFSIIPLMRVLH